MKKILMFVLVLCLAAGMAAIAFAESADNTEIKCELTNGSYVIRISLAENDEGWYADEMLDNASVVKLGSAEKQDGCFVVRYDPVADGTATVSVRHYYCASACDQAHTWDLVVKDGKIEECVGGSYTANPAEEEQDPFISGEWLEKDTQFTKMTVTKNEARGWDVEAVSPMTHGAYIFKATVQYDCYLDAFVYDKGKFFNLPLEGNDLGEPTAAGATGSLKLEADEENNLSLVWAKDEAPEEAVRFEKSGNGEALSFEQFDGMEWSFSSGAGAWSTDMRLSADGSFSGEFHDSEMGDAAENYPNGTVYICSFTGQMTLLEQADEYSWLVRIDNLTLEQEPEKETIEDGICFVTAEAYGISEGDTMRLYRPGTPVEMLTEDMRMWAHLFDMEEKPSELQDWFLYSEKNESGFVGVRYDSAVNLANPWVDLTADQLTQVSGLSFGVPEGAENVLYRWLESEGLAEMQFSVDSDEYCARIQPAALQAGELMNISGMYFAWENEEEISVGHCYGTIGQAKTGSEDWVELCLWYDAAPGLMYSLSVYTTEPDGLDLTAVAEQVYIPMQGND